MNEQQLRSTLIAQYPVIVQIAESYAQMYPSLVGTQPYRYAIGVLLSGQSPAITTEDAAFIEMMLDEFDAGAGNLPVQTVTVTGAKWWEKIAGWQWLAIAGAAALLLSGKKRGR